MMNNLYNIKTITVTVEKLISAPAKAVFKEWIDPNFPGSPWNGGIQTLLEPRRDGFFYLKNLSEDKSRELANYGLFLVFEPSLKLEHTWISQKTRGLESLVTIVFDDRVDHTLVTITHENLPDDDYGHQFKRKWENCLSRFEGLAKWQEEG